MSVCMNMECGIEDISKDMWRHHAEHRLTVPLALGLRDMAAMQGQKPDTVVLDPDPMQLEPFVGSGSGHHLSALSHFELPPSGLNWEEEHNYS